MVVAYYFDTSVWLDFFEDRDEPNLPKSTWAKKLVEKINNEGGMIFLSDANLLELEAVGYSVYDIEHLLTSLQPLLMYIESTPHQVGKAKDLASKSSIPKRDALHALLARDHHAILVTLDNHFDHLTDITKPHRPQDLI